MSDMNEVLKSKNLMRRQLAQLPIAQKLTMLDALRERHIALSQSTKSKAPDSNLGRVPGANS